MYYLQQIKQERIEQKTRTYMYRNIFCIHALQFYTINLSIAEILKIIYKKYFIPLFSFLVFFESLYSHSIYTKLVSEKS